MKRIIGIIMLTMVLHSGTSAQFTYDSTYTWPGGYLPVWTYYLEIIDTTYVPKIINKNELGYITLHTGITDYDAVYAKYKLTNFFPICPECEKLKQIFILKCDSGLAQIQLGHELIGKYSHVIPSIELDNHMPIEASGLKENWINEVFQKGKILYIGDNNHSKKTVRFYDMYGRLIFSKITTENTVNPQEFTLKKGIYMYEIITDKSIKGKYLNF